MHMIQKTDFDLYEIISDIESISQKDLTLYHHFDGYLDGYGHGRVRINLMKTRNFHAHSLLISSPKTCLQLLMHLPTQALSVKYVLVRAFHPSEYSFCLKK